MHFASWVIVFFVNLFVLLVTVTVPADTTALSMIPIVLSTSTVLIDKLSDEALNKIQKILFYILVFISGLFAVECGIISYGCEINLQELIYKCKEETILKDFCFSYHYFWIPVASWCVLLPLILAICEFINSKSNTKRRDKSFAELLNI